MRRVRELLVMAAHSVQGAPAERQGAGAVDAGLAVALALADRHSAKADYAASPRITPTAVEFLLHDHRAKQVSVVGSWNGWQRPGLSAREVESGLWLASSSPLPAGGHAYKFLLDGDVWLADPANPVRQHDGHGGWNSVVRV